MKQLFIATLCALSLSVTASAQNELSGNWTFDQQESISGKLYVNGSPKTVKIAVDGKRLTFEEVNTDSDNNDITIKETMSLNNAPLETKNSSGKRRKVLSIKNDGNKYIETVTIYNDMDSSKAEYKTTDTWWIENGELILDRKDENLINGEVWESKATYKKQ